MSYIPLHLHSQYSILDSTLSIETIVSKAKSDNLSAVALTDSCNMYGAVEFYKECKQAGIQPILGCEMMVAPTSRHEKKRIYGVPSAQPLLILAKDKQGYKNLCKLSSIAFLEGFYYTPRIDKELLKEYSAGLICLTGPFYGRVGSLITAGDEEGLQAELDWLQAVFGEDLYLEISRHRMTEELLTADGVTEESWLYQKFLDAFTKQETILERARGLSESRGIPLVATGDIHYLEREDFRAHEILLNVQSGEPCEIWERDAYGNPRSRSLNPKRETTYSHELYFKSPAEMEALFADLPGAIESTVEIAKKCHMEFDFQKKFYPVFVPAEMEGTVYTDEERALAAKAFLKKLCQEALSKRYTEEKLAKVSEKYPDQDPMVVVRDRLAYELDLIISKDMADYLLIVYDFIAWAKSQNIPVGPGRGSGAGSIVLYLIGITDIEPLRFNLFFERFINPERISYPDVDVDICMDRRGEVIEYTLNKYGRDKVAQIITFGTMKAKMVLKDVGRVLSIPLTKVNEIAKLVPEEIGITLDQALAIDPDLQRLYQTDEETKRIIDFGKKLEGSIRNTGIHAAGLIICGDPLTDHIPVCNAKDSDIVVTQYSMKPVEMVGMLKIDFLGLKTLTSIQKTVDAIYERDGNKIDWVNLPLEDEKTFNLLNQGKTSGIFQLESGGMQELARQLHIDKFEEIIAVGALYRPGPMEMIPSFIQRKHGLEEIHYDHEWLKGILQETYGIVVYQEQVMQLASKLAGYSLGEGDVLRRAMGKKDKKEMGRQREKFKEGALQNNIPEEQSMMIFDKVEKFASYGFNKSHAAAYGYLSYVTAYFKANYPTEWMAALMTCDMADLTKVARHIQEAQSVQIAVLPPHINESKHAFIAGTECIRFGLAAIKGVGSGVVEAITQERVKGGAYGSLQDFLERSDTSQSGQIGKKVIEHLIHAGAFDWTNWTRKELHAALMQTFDLIIAQKKELAKGILDLFGGSGAIVEKAAPTKPEVEVQYTKLETLSKEKELLGFYVTGHPLEEYKEKIATLALDTLEGIPLAAHQSIVKVAFIVETVVARISQRSQKKFVILTVSDGVEHYELPIWPELYEQRSSALKEGALLVAILQIDHKAGEAVKLSCKWIGELTTLEGALMQEFEAAFTSATDQARLDKKRDIRSEKAKIQDQEKNKPIKLTLDLDKLTLKSILHLKQLFQDHAGGSPVELEFLSPSSSHTKTLHIDPALGIDQAVVSKLTALHYVKSCVVLA